MSKLKDFFTVVGSEGQVDCTGLSVVTIPCSSSDTIGIQNIDTDISITLSELSAGRTVILCFESTANAVTFTNTIYWAGGELPDLTVGYNNVVITQANGVTLAGASLAHTIPV